MKEALSLITDVWGWVGLFLGAIVAYFLFLYGLTPDTDLGTALTGGALVGVTSRTAFGATQRKKRLRSRLASLEEVIETYLRVQKDEGESGKAQELLDVVKREGRLYTSGVTTLNELELQLIALTAEYRKLAPLEQVMDL